MDSPDDPTTLTLSQRRREVAAILARAVLRLHGMGQTAPPEDASESAQNGLEVSVPSSPHVTCG